MEIKNSSIDSGKAFDWGKTSADYAKYRDIYPDIFYKKILDRNLCIAGQNVLDLGTGTGVLPRNMYQYGAKWVGTDIAENQIMQARKMSEELNQKIEYLNVPTEELNFPDQTFDVITACQCFWYFDHKKVTPLLARMLKKDGSLLVLYMAWLPFEDRIAGESEKLVLKYSPHWSGAGETIHPITVPDCVLDIFTPVFHEEYEVDVPFTRESWNGRMKACRGVGASLSAGEVTKWEKEHRAMLEKIAPEQFTIRHYAAMLELKQKV
ncbi:MAG: class I SAM-dependent methyltransferase [Faecalicatena sp.]|uniref:class I SAM-dependent methyltransferase n=1 Tax=Faecalicatena sp. TaxID=2005360 RepID=UPI00258C76B9|nr:class I SAM-dependent methyltransferase [Faecalicatena sp.]MCI6464405.1 class I SAM-dependent methyltransferase [Faecalicatena sp.]MDY5620143.1 class I SAM-dependent methyltransferase [Lachnospiraceae bacterium]